MASDATPDRLFLNRIGVHKAQHQDILLDRLPCGIKTAQKAYDDSTSWLVNAPRALLVCFWKGMVAAFQKLESSDGK